MTSNKFELRFIQNAPDLRQFYENLPLHSDGYKFDFETENKMFVFCSRKSSDGTYVTDIIRQPGYGNRDSSSHATHRLTRTDGSIYICHKPGTEPRDLPTAAAIAIWWAKCTVRYIRDGRSWS